MRPGNQAPNTNSVVGLHANLEITNHGSDWYFAVCAIMGVSTLIFWGLASRKSHTERVFLYITGAITAMSCVAYFAMGSNLGQVPIQVEFHRPGRITRSAGTREIFYARYIDGAVTVPLLLLDLLLMAGVPSPTLLVTILTGEIMVVCGLLGALTQTVYKFGFLGFSIGALIFVAIQLFTVGRFHANKLGVNPKNAFLLCAGWLVFIWSLYPVAWGLSEGGNVIHPDSEAIFYGVLDICAKPIFGALLIWSHRKVHAADLGLFFPCGYDKVNPASAAAVTEVAQVNEAPPTTTSAAV